MTITESPTTYDVEPFGYGATYWTPEGDKTVALGIGVDGGRDPVIAIVTDREDGSVLEWITADTYWETAVNVATWGRLHVWDEATVNPSQTVRRMVQEVDLYTDCFGS